MERVIVSAVVERDGMLLFARKPKNVGPYPNKLHLLGGGVNEGESLVDALRREVREEANIAIDRIAEVAVIEDDEPDKHGVMTHYIFHAFRGWYRSGELRPGDDIAELIWLPKEKLYPNDFPKSSVRVFEKLGWIGQEPEA